MTTSEFIKLHIQKAGITKYRLHILTGITEINLARIEKGDQMPSVHNFIKICQALNVTKEDMANFYDGFTQA